jgi:hypothetical protein
MEPLTEMIAPDLITEKLAEALRNKPPQEIEGIGTALFSEYGQKWAKRSEA